MTPEPRLTLRLSAEDRALVWEYGYPFADLKAQLERVTAVNKVCSVTIEPFYLDHLLADLIRSMKTIRRRALLERLDELYIEIECQAAEQGYSP